MKQSQWKRSIGLLGLMSTLAVAEEPARAAEPAKAKPTNDAHPAEAPALNPRRSAMTAGELKTKLESIVLDEISYDGLPLAEIIKTLRNESLARDPQKVGVNFMFGQPSEAIRQPMTVDSATGLPVAGPVAETQDPGVVTIRINPPLKKIRLMDALDAVVRVADRPIKYTIEGYAVVWALDGERINALASGIVAAPPAPVLQTQAFKVDTNVFFSSLHQMFRVSPNESGSDTAEILRGHVFPRMGVTMNSDRLVLYNPFTGVVLVRATPEEFLTIQPCMDALSGVTTSLAPKNLSKREEGTPGLRK
jgi:hypothetical protein